MKIQNRPRQVLNNNASPLANNPPALANRLIKLTALALLVSTGANYLASKKLEPLKPGQDIPEARHSAINHFPLRATSENHNSSPGMIGKHGTMSNYGNYGNYGGMGGMGGMKGKSKVTSHSEPSKSHDYSPRTLKQGSMSSYGKGAMGNYGKGAMGNYGKDAMGNYGKGAMDGGKSGIRGEK